MPPSLQLPNHHCTGKAGTRVADAEHAAEKATGSPQAWL